MKESTVRNTSPNFEALFQFGEILDAGDAGMSGISAADYGAAANDAKQFIETNWGHPTLQRQCGRAAYLQDLYVVVDLENRHQESLARLRLVHSKT